MKDAALGYNLKCLGGCSWGIQLSTDLSDQMDSILKSEWIVGDQETYILYLYTKFYKDSLKHPTFITGLNERIIKWT